MFDDNNNPSTPPANLPVEAPDMFADVDKDMPPAAPNAIDAGLLKKKDAALPTADSGVPGISTMPVSAAPAMYSMKEPVLGKIVLGVVMLLVLGGLGFGGWWLYSVYSGNDNIPPVAENADNTTATEEPVQTEQPVVTPDTDTADTGITADMANDRILFGEPVDTDGDTLDDVREREIGTDPNNNDTDGDTLKDGEEVIIWKTDPLNPDTDGDTFVDGVEVKNGYNPLGPGKLFNVPTSTPAISTSSATETK